jgi:hypothetical protein
MRWRLAARIAGAAVLLAAAALALAIWWLGSSGAKAYAAGQWALAESRYARAEGAMPFERWKAPFGAGTATLSNGDAEGAETTLKRALETVPAAQECLVRINLSLAQERQGDAAAEAGGEAGVNPAERWETALATLRDGDCPASSEQAAQAEQRLEEKLGQSADQSDQSEPEPDPSQDPSQSPSDSASPSPSESGGEGQSGSPSTSPEPGGESGQPSQEATPSLDPETQRKLDQLEELNDEARRERGDNREYKDSTGTIPKQDTPIW